MKVVNKWREIWQKETKESKLRLFFPEVSRYSWVVSDYETSQILYGHGCFNKNVHVMRLKDTSICECELDDESVRLMRICAKHC